MRYIFARSVVMSLMMRNYLHYIWKKNVDSVEQIYRELGKIMIIFGRDQMIDKSREDFGGILTKLSEKNTSTTTLSSIKRNMRLVSKKIVSGLNATKPA